MGIASIGNVGVKELVRVLQVTVQACPFWDFAIPFGRNGSRCDEIWCDDAGIMNYYLFIYLYCIKWLTSYSKDPTAEVIE